MKMISTIRNQRENAQTEASPVNSERILGTNGKFTVEQQQTTNNVN